MAGSPAKRARRELAERIARELIQQGAIPEATRAPTRTRAREGEPMPPGVVRLPTRAAVPLGPQARAAVDTHTTDALAAFAAHLGPGIVCTVERTRPTWCAGWVCDVDLEDGTLQELRGYLRDECGGESYRVSAIYDGRPVYTAKVNIAGPPRNAGKIINRDAWDAQREGRAPATPATPAASPGFDLFGKDGLLSLILTESRESRNSTLNAVKEMTEHTSKTTAELVDAFAKEARANRQSSTLAEQIGHMQRDVAAVDGLRQSIVEANPVPPEPDDDDEHGGTRRLVRTAAENFMAQALTGMGGARGPATSAPAPSPAAPGGIPDAAPVRRVVGRVK
jgi:hypothetical protein